MTKEKIKTFCEKIFDKNTKLKGDQSFFFQIGNGTYGWCVGTPLLLSDLTKEEAKELKTLLEPLANLSEMELRQLFTYDFWIPKNQERYFEDGKLNNTNSKSFTNNLSELIRELENKRQSKIGLGKNIQFKYGKRIQLQPST